MDYRTGSGRSAMALATSFDSRLDGCSPPDRRASASAPAPALQLVDARPGPDREQRARPCGETHLLTDLIAVWEGAHERVGAV